MTYFYETQFSLVFLTKCYKTSQILELKVNFALEYKIRFLLNSYSDAHIGWKAPVKLGLFDLKKWFLEYLDLCGNYFL